MRHLLYLPHRIPYPPNKGDKIRAWHILAYLQRHFHVHLGTFVDHTDDWQYVERLQAMCASSCFVPLRPWRARLRSLAALAGHEPVSLRYYRARPLQQWVAHTLSQQPIAAALAFSGPMAQYVPAHGAQGPLHRVMDLVDVDSEKWLAYADTRPWPLSRLYQREARCLLDYERAIARQFDRTTLVSAPEAALFRTRAPDSGHKIEHFSNGVDSAYFAPDPGRPDPYPPGQTVLVFTGAMDYWPNVEAVRWFAARVLPALRANRPALHFHIVGARPAAAVTALAAEPGIHVSGSVPDIRPYLQHAAVAVAPLQIARGIQNKVLEAMSMALPVVASAAALQGLDVTPGHEVLCADRADAWAGQITRALDCQHAHAIGTAARRHVLAHFDWDHNLARLGTMLGVDTLAREAAP
ncbi:MAG: TIGR03087 family PEP-CTERM/XrtA system glycosyltransferase [Pseudomonadota bacterium]